MQFLRKFRDFSENTEFVLEKHTIKFCKNTDFSALFDCVFLLKNVFSLKTACFFTYFLKETCVFYKIDRAIFLSRVDEV